MGEVVDDLVAEVGDELQEAREQDELEDEAVTDPGGASDTQTPT